MYNHYGFFRPYHPETVNNLYWQGIRDYANGNYPLAAEELRRALALAPESELVHNLLSRVEQELDSPEAPRYTL